MRKAAAIFLVLLLCLPVFLAAQDEGEEPDIETDWDDYSDELYAAGDQTFVISLGVIFPVVFLTKGGSPIRSLDKNFHPPIGGTGTLAFNYYLSSRIYVGGELSGMFIPTIAKNTLFIIPLGLRLGYQFIAGRFEFPVTVAAGMAWHTYLNYGYYGFYLKAGAAAYFRATHSWSFGLTSNWYWLPQWTDYASHDVNGHFTDLMLSARYHF